jgi:hypothetical protein
VSAIPTVLDALRAGLGVAMPGVQILDGPPTVEVQGDVVAVGFSPDPDGAAVEATEATADLGGGGREDFDVLGAASSWTGDTEIKTRRDRAFALIAAIKGELKRDPHVGGTCAQARLRITDYVPAQTTKGAVVTVTFRISVVAFGG